MVPANRRKGAKERPALRAKVNSTAPRTLTPPACNSSLRIHFQERRKVSRGKRNAAAPNNWKHRSERYDPLPGKKESEQGEEKRGRAEQLEAQVGEIRSRVADQIQGAGSGSGVERRVLGVVRDEAQ